MEIKDTIITADAAFTHEAATEEIIKGGGDFALALKGNSPNLHRWVKDLFTAYDLGHKSPEAGLMNDFSEEIEYNHGRIERRKIEVLDMPWEYQNGHKYIKQLCRITREREKKIRKMIISKQ